MPGGRSVEGGRRGPMIRDVPGRSPRIHPDVYVDPAAQVIGDVLLWHRDYRGNPSGWHRVRDWTERTGG